ncbi:Uncharacterized protein dnm_099080 [Desulfonema magnum]|uniref:Uncharacterized protein n=1 Tax=Desulfonema magnum TaxID=45655 RepID=A0A975BYB3_9BACT|nr:Uncharacterized protein dnm_099080 [Desulfonema magnum]
MSLFSDSGYSRSSSLRSEYVATRPTTRHMAADTGLSVHLSRTDCYTLPLNFEKSGNDTDFYLHPTGFPNLETGFF